jgi:hypothetical protein
MKASDVQRAANWGADYGVAPPRLVRRYSLSTPVRLSSPLWL